MTGSIIECHTSTYEWLAANNKREIVRGGLKFGIQHRQGGGTSL